MPIPICTTKKRNGYGAKLIIPLPHLMRGDGTDPIHEVRMFKEGYFLYDIRYPSRPSIFGPTRTQRECVAEADRLTAKHYKLWDAA